MGLVLVENKKRYKRHLLEGEGETAAVYLGTVQGREYYYRYDAINDRYVLDVKYGAGEREYFVQTLHSQKDMPAFFPKFIVARAWELKEIHEKECEILGYERVNRISI